MTTDYSTAPDRNCILIVEDSETQATRLRLLLEANHYRVAVATNGLDALDYLKTQRPAIIISDIVMPGMDGYELCQQVKGNPDYADIRVMLLTSLSNPVDIIKGLNCGADNFLTKPYHDEMLLSRVRHILINAELRTRETISFGMEVYFAGKKHFLSAERIQIIDLLLATYENAVQKSKELEQSHKELRKAYETIIALEATYRTLLEQNADAMVVVGLDGEVHYVNAAAERLFGLSREAFLARPFPFSVEAEETLEVRLMGDNNTEVIAEMRVAYTNWEREPAYLATLRDVTEHVRMREELNTLSLTDPLTGLYNRRGFTTLIDQQLKVSQRSKQRFALLYADLDDMKAINDTFGHPLGDLALIDTANLLRETFRTSDIVARIGGDEFAVVVLDCPKHEANTLQQRFAAALLAFSAKLNRSYSLSISLGIAHYEPESAMTLDDLIAAADHAMYEVKQARKLAR